MRGALLDPACANTLLATHSIAGKDVDGRNKSGHDGVAQGFIGSPAGPHLPPIDSIPLTEC